MDAPYKLELIEWLDHCTLDGGAWRNWGDLEDLSPGLVRSVGWVTSENDEFLVMVSHAEKDVLWGEFCVVKGCIKRRLVLLDDGKDETDRVQAGLCEKSKSPTTGRTRPKSRRHG